jgi:hypothetical protein
VTPEDREVDARADAREMCQIARRIVALGRARFDDPGDPIVRLAAKALVLDLAAALERAPQWRAEQPILWRGLKRTRDRLAHHYVDLQYDVLWEVVTDDFSAVEATLGKASP